MNKPDEFIITVESFIRNIHSLGPLKRSAETQFKLNAVYELVKTNSRVRSLLSSSLRRPWEKTYRGDQRHALEYDQDFSAVLEEEFMNQQLLQLLRSKKRPLKLRELADRVCQSETQVAEGLMELVADGSIRMSHEDRKAVLRAA